MEIRNKIIRYLIRSRARTYNISELVKEYCNYPSWVNLPFNIHHGWYARINPRQKDLKPATYPIMLVWNKRQEKEWVKHSNIPVSAIGAPFIHYRRKHNIKQDVNAKG
jgi:hypothetical protein